MNQNIDDIKITIDDFHSINWKEIIRETTTEEYFSLKNILFSKANETINEGKLAQGKILRLLGDAYSMMLVPESLNEPFKPFLIIDGKRSALPEDFSNEDINFFKSISTLIGNSRLESRIADILWLISKPKKIEYALRAIDYYKLIELNENSWIDDGKKCWERAIQLCLMLGEVAISRLNELENRLIESLTKATTADGYLAFGIAELLLKNKLGMESQEIIANQLATLAIQFSKEDDLHSSQDHFYLSSEWYKKLGDKDKAAKMLCNTAECYVKDALLRQNSDVPSYSVAVDFFEKAIQTYRKIPKELRENYDVARKIKELQVLMRDSGEKSLNEMKRFTSEPVDISDIVRYSIQIVKGQDTLEALTRFANIYNGFNMKKAYPFAREMIEKFPLQTLLSTVYLSSDNGRVIGKQSAGEVGSPTEKMVYSRMIQYYLMDIGLVVQGYIWPALEILRQEHRITESDFHVLASRSPIVPPDRVRLIAKGLFKGYDNDFVSAIHILVPQLENLVRYHLKQRGEITTNLDKNGLETENSLKTLMGNPIINEIFGEDLSFEVKVLFCDSQGINMRNNLAHGLVDYDASEGIYVVYAWWLILKMVFNTFYNRSYRKNA